MQISLFKLLLVFISLFFLAGCATTTGSSSSELKSEEETFARSTLAVNTKLRFDDLPVPRGFKLLEEESYVFQTEETRVALLKYAGRAKLHDLVDFYQEQMLLYNWKLLNVVEYGRSVLNFEQGSQSCIVTIEPRGMKKIVTISVAPKAKASLETKAQK